jgi:DNA-binding protein H-NS
MEAFMDAKELAAEMLAVQGQIDALLAKEQLSADDRAEVKTLETKFEKLSADKTAAEHLAAEDAATRERARKRLTCSECWHRPQDAAG